MAAERPLAVVTGASSGIGAAFARELARRGHDLALVARDEAALRALATEVGERGAAAHVLVADLGTDAGSARAERFLADPPAPVRLLVNNAATGGYGDLATQDPDTLEVTLRVNALALARLTRAVLPAMIRDGSGGVVLVSSPAAGAPVPGLAPYSATKAFVDRFGSTLREEVAPHGVVVTTVWPGWTRTAFHDRVGQDVGGVPAEAWQGPDAVARAALDGHARGAWRVEVPEPGPRERLTRLTRVARAELGAPWPDRWRRPWTRLRRS